MSCHPDSPPLALARRFEQAQLGYNLGAAWQRVRWCEGAAG